MGTGVSRMIILNNNILEFIYFLLLLLLLLLNLSSSIKGPGHKLMKVSLP